MPEDPIDAQISPLKKAEHFISNLDWTAFGIAFVLSLGVYVYTLAPTVTLEDSGEMAVACDYLGVPHPPGYPLWTMLGWVFTEIFSFVKFRGQPNPAWAVALMSSFFGALTSGVTAILVSRVGRRHLLKSENGDTSRLLPLVAGVAAGLAMAFAPVQWSQSVIVEVYTMNAFLVVLLLLLAGMWAEQQSNTLLYAMALVFGISFTHYFYASAVNIIILATVIYVHDKDLFWDSMASGMILVGTILLLRDGFGDNLKQFLSYAIAMTKWTLGKVDNAPESAADSYTAFYGAIVTVVVGVIICAVINRQLRGRKTQAYAAKWIVALICIVIAARGLAGAFESSTMLTEAVADRKAGYFTAGMIILMLPILLWIFQAGVFPGIDRKYMLLTIPALLFFCVLIGGEKFIEAVTAGKNIPQGAQGFQVMNIIPRSKAVFLCAVCMTIAPIIWLARGKGFNEWKRIIPMGILIVAVWFLIHMYLPWSSDRNPPMNWGYPRTMEGFKHAVFRGQYQKIQPFNPMSANGVRQTGHYFGLLFKQFTTPIALLGLLPLACWVIRLGRWRLRGVTICLAAGILAVPFYVPVKISQNFSGTAPPEYIVSIYAAFIALIVICALAGFLALLAGKNIGKLLASRYASVHTGYYALSALLALIVFIPLKSIKPEMIKKVFGAKKYASMKYSSVFWSEVRVQILQMLQVVILAALAILILLALIILLQRLTVKLWSIRLERSAAIYVSFGMLAAIILCVLLLHRAPMNLESFFAFLKEPLSTTHLFGRWVDGGNGDKVFIVGSFLCLLLYIPTYLSLVCGSLVLLRFIHDTAYPDDDPELNCEWETDSYFREGLLVTVYTFLVWGLVFACFANIKLDVQDTFIQRVKFLTSYTIFSIWIGYGLMLVARRKLPKAVMPYRRMLGAAGICFMILMPAIPLLNNAYNRRIINEVGACDLNGHDFGWQFGNYQLRGAEAIIEELDPDEEPLPNPMYPEEMGPRAVFFGGTDPGRFVPTYMIFSAQVRPDVYLITQNALADNTYMSVMRDLYGDEIWIPAEPDSAKAFDRYVKEVKAGKRPPNAHIKIDQGRVQVSGALGVMEINGILAQMIFEHNNYRHDHYVEESYVLRWMYPYLTPHGLIMKINREKTAITPDNARNDMYFWDWYTRRHLDNKKFTRDVAARKSFSKLRSSIAGLYANRRMWREAEHAFKEAVLLYPSTPEGNLRIISEVYLNRELYDDSRRMLRNLQRLDPHSDKIDPLFNNINQIEKVRSRMKVLEIKMKNKQLQLQDAFELAQLYLQLRQMGPYLGITRGILQDKKLPAAWCYRLAKLHEQAKQWKDMSQALDECMARMPANTQPEAFIDLTQLYIKAQNLPSAARAIQRYLKLKPNDWKAWLDLSKMQAQALKQNKEALVSLERAVQLGGSQVLQIARKDGTLAPLLQKVSTVPKSNNNNQQPGRGNFNRILQPGKKAPGLPLGPRK